MVYTPHPMKSVGGTDAALSPWTGTRLLPVGGSYGLPEDSARTNESQAEVGPLLLAEYRLPFEEVIVNQFCNPQTRTHCLVCTEKPTTFTGIMTHVEQASNR